MALLINGKKVSGLGAGVASGGITGQVLVKKSDASYDTEWAYVDNKIELDETLSQSGTAADAKAVGDEIAQLSDSINNLQISGLTTAQVNALDSMFNVVAYIKDVSVEYAAFKTAFGIIDNGGETPDEPDNPDVTITTISATYSGGDVTVGTALTDLTGITVTGNYSDGSTINIIGYTLSGTIVEGNNIITVTYEDLTTTFAVTGVAESSGGEATTGNLLYSWDFTSGLIDSVSGQVVTLSGATQDSNGLHLASASDYALFGVSVYNKTVEIEFGEVAHAGFTGHGRLVTFNNSATGTDCSRGLIWRNTGKWASYFGAWSDSESTDNTLLSNKKIKVKLYNDNSNKRFEVSVDGEILIDAVLTVSAYVYMTIGAVSNAFYNATIKSVKVYEEVA